MSAPLNTLESRLRDLAGQYRGLAGMYALNAREATRAQERAHWQHMIEVARQRAAEMDAQAERARKLGGHGHD